jgi:hypothetical protein
MINVLTDPSAAVTLWVSQICTRSAFPIPRKALQLLPYFTAANIANKAFIYPTEYANPRVAAPSSPSNAGM